jgi:hypothetical protein
VVYAHRSEFRQHKDAVAALETITERPWGLPVFVIGEFLRVATHPAVLTPPSKRQVALEVVDALLATGTAQVLRPGEMWWPLLRSLVDDSRIVGNAVSDAKIAALCAEHGVDEILTEDRGFLRFPGLRVRGL